MRVKFKKRNALLVLTVLIFTTIFSNLPLVTYANTLEDSSQPTNTINQFGEDMENITTFELGSEEASYIESIVLFTEVYPEGEKVIGAAVKLSETITSEGIDKDTFTVKAETFSWETFGLEWGERTISEIYVHNGPEFTTEPSETGNYVIMKLDSNDANAGSFNYDLVTGLNSPVPYQFTLEKELVTVKGDKIIPDGENYNPTGSITPIVDEFGKYEISHEGFTMNYRLFEPTTEEGEKYPLVIFLHGAGERGNDNELQLRGNRGALTWAEPEFQSKHPSFVVAPQVKPDGWWANENETKTVIKLIENLMETYPIDENRVYITGVSMGGFGTWNILGVRPDLFAAAIPICGGLSLTGDTDLNSYAEIVKHIPIWTTHSADDSVVNIEETTNKIIDAIENAGEIVIRGEYAGNLSKEDNNTEAQQMWDQAVEKDSHILFTTYTEGTTPTMDHWSWVPTYENDVIKEWLFAQVKAEPTEPGETPGEEPGEGPAEEPGEDPIEEPTEQTGEDSAKEPTDEPSNNNQDKENGEKPGQKLPSTATVIPNLLLAGTLLTMVSAIVYMYYRKRYAN